MREKHSDKLTFRSLFFVILVRISFPAEEKKEEEGEKESFSAFLKPRKEEQNLFCSAKMEIFPLFSSSEKLFEIWIRKLMAGSETQEY
jgi:hypothetical protein